VMPPMITGGSASRGSPAGRCLSNGAGRRLGFLRARVGSGDACQRCAGRSPRLSESSGAHPSGPNAPRSPPRAQTSAARRSAWRPASGSLQPEAQPGSDCAWPRAHRGVSAEPFATSRSASAANEPEWMRPRGPHAPARACFAARRPAVRRCTSPSRFFSNPASSAHPRGW
jgi:hypothetical protein